MIQLVLLNGVKAGCHCVARRFPFRVGRSPGADLALEGDGVWEEHAQIVFRPDEGISIQAQGQALVSVNGQRAHQARLRNGDLIECGSVRLRFWLAPVSQASLRPREALTWAGIGLLFVLQLGLVYLLLG